MNAHDAEKAEEEKLKAKYPSASQGLRAPGGHSAFLQKRLQKGVSACDPTSCIMQLLTICPPLRHVAAKVF